MVKALIFDFSRTLIFPKDRAYQGELNELYKKLIQDPSFDFLVNFELNEELIVFLTNIKEKYKLYLFTSGNFQNAPEIKDKITALFDEIFSAQDLMVSKSEPETYKKIAENLKLHPDDILFIDDSTTNIQAAKFAGMETLQYTDNKSVTNYIDTLG